MISVDRLALRDFRSYAELEVSFGPGLTAVIGENGNGKTNLIEAVGFLARLSSFRGAPTEALIREGAEHAIVRAELTCGDRDVLIEAQIQRKGGPKVQVNKQKLVRRGDLADVMTTTVFSPDDLEIVKGSPGGRRDYLDDLLVDLHPKNAAACSDFAKVLKQRGALLKQMSGRRNHEAELTLDVWDQRMAEHGERLAGLRNKLMAQLAPLVTESYALVSNAPADIGLHYSSEWTGVGLSDALVGSRDSDIRRGVSTTGPHRDDLELTIGGLAARTHASQGEQRSLVLALRLGAHRLVTIARGQAPVLLLDDVFSELDPGRSAALLACLPEGQKILTTATDLPDGASADSIVRIASSTATVAL